MNNDSAASDDKIAAPYDRVIRETRQTYGDVIDEERVMRVASDAVDELVLRQGARVTNFVPVLAMRMVRDTITATASASEDAEPVPTT
jgi:hypothetical protein